ncbi:MAG: lysylphosphatidylglycerol synthase transmembrane domain-containing protein [Actinomycetota bacterium]
MTARSALVLFLRIGVSVGLLVFLFVQVRIDFGELWPDDGTAVAWLLFAFGCMVGSLVLASLRWQQVCRALHLDVSSVRLFWHTIAGQFLSNFVPTTVGGDVLRVSRLGKDTGDRPTSFTTVILERLSGWMVLPASIFLGLALDPSLRGLGAATRGAMVAAIVTLVALSLIILAAGNDFTGRLLERYEGPLRWLHAVHEGLDALRERPRQIVRILATGAAYQGMLIVAFWAAAQSIGIEGFGLRAAAAFVPAVLIVQVLPLGIGGLGVREGTLVLFLGSLDVPDEQAVALGLTIYALTILMSLIGLPSLVFGGGLGDDEEDDGDPDEGDVEGDGEGDGRSAAADDGATESPDRN